MRMLERDRVFSVLFPIRDFSQVLLLIFECFFLVLCSLGDEIIAVNGTTLQGLTHAEAIAVFKEIKSGSVMLHIGRRDQLQKRLVVSK